MRTPPAVFVLPGAVFAVLAGCAAPVARTSVPLSRHSVSVGTEPANGIRVRGRCEVAPSLTPITSRAQIVRVDAGWCHLTHLGTVSVEVEQELNVALGTQSAQLTLTTADGAQVQLSAVGDSDGRVNPTRFNGAARVVGGTGRFWKAIGAVRTEGATMSRDIRGGRVGGSGVLKIDGWIAYEGVGPSGAEEGGDR